MSTCVCTAKWDRRRLNQHGLRIQLAVRFQRIQIFRIDIGRRHVESGQHLLQQTLGSPVQIERHEQMISGTEQGEDDLQRGHARASRKACVPAFQIGACRAFRSGVIEACALPKAGMLKCGGRIDRKAYRSGLRIVLRSDLG